MKTVVQFDLFRGSDDYYTDPRSLYVFGFIDFNMLEELMTSSEYLNYMVEDLEVGKFQTVTMEVWEDSDDYETWLDYELLPDDYEI